MQKLDEFRYFLGRFERITGSAPKTRSFEEFLTDFQFNQRPGLIEMDGCLFVFFCPGFFGVVASSTDRHRETSPSISGDTTTLLGVFALFARECMCIYIYTHDLYRIYIYI